MFYLTCDRSFTLAGGYSTLATFHQIACIHAIWFHSVAALWLCHASALCVSVRAVVEYSNIRILSRPNIRIQFSQRIPALVSVHSSAALTMWNDLLSELEDQNISRPEHSQSDRKTWLFSSVSTQSISGHFDWHIDWTDDAITAAITTTALCNDRWGYGTKPQPKANLVHLSFKIWHLVAPILLIFVRITSIYGPIIAGDNAKCTVAHPTKIFSGHWSHAAAPPWYMHQIKCHLTTQDSWTAATEMLHWHAHKNDDCILRTSEAPLDTLTMYPQQWSYMRHCDPRCSTTSQTAAAAATALIRCCNALVATAVITTVSSRHNVIVTYAKV